MGTQQRHTRLKYLYLVILLSFNILLFGQNKPLVKSEINAIVSKIKNEQNRIDLIDSTLDKKITLKVNDQTIRATQIFIYKTNDIIMLLQAKNMDYQSKFKKITCLYELLTAVHAENIQFLDQIETQINYAAKTLTHLDTIKFFKQIEANPKMALEILPFYLEMPYTKDFLLKTSILYPVDVLGKYKLFNKEVFAKQILETTSKHAPGDAKAYLYTENHVSQDLKKSEDPGIRALVKMYELTGMRSKCYAFLDEIVKGKITIEKADEIGQNENLYLKNLLRLANKQGILAKYTIERDLKELSQRKIREINDLHESTDQIRFASVQNLSASELYTLMVLGEDEIYTSTFLGLYNRLIPKITEKSNFEFIKNQNWFNYRTFIKMCAGYNTLNLFLTKMKIEEKNELIKKFCEGIETTNNFLENAVIIADTYGSIKDEKTKNEIKKILSNYYLKMVGMQHQEGIILYKILNELAENTNTEVFNPLTVALQKDLFVDDICLEQHLFYDDEDGKASFNSFVESFKKPDWIILDSSNYVKIYPKTGKKIFIYANKPEKEYEGMEQLRKMFEKLNHWPDIVVHRGHSYYAYIAIETLTPYSKIVILGSCGGYNNISKVLAYTPNGQIISSKQIGTMTVNNEMIYQLNENLRLGKDINWDKLWVNIALKLKSDPLAYSRFMDYIPPHKNLGARLIKSYREKIQ